ncbi:hypothetical protein SMICM304S_07438 [Streptomyces microflavus]
MRRPGLPCGPLRHTRIPTERVDRRRAGERDDFVSAEEENAMTAETETTTQSTGSCCSPTGWGPRRAAPPNVPIAAKDSVDHGVRGEGHACGHRRRRRVGRTSPDSGASGVDRGRRIHRPRHGRPQGLARRRGRATIDAAGYELVGRAALSARAPRSIHALYSRGRACQQILGRCAARPVPRSSDMASTAAVGTPAANGRRGRAHDRRHGTCGLVRRPTSRRSSTGWSAVTATVSYATEKVRVTFAEGVELAEVVATVERHRLRRPATSRLRSGNREGNRERGHGRGRG